MSAVRIGRAYSPENRLGNPTQGVALGWYVAGPLALGIRQELRAKGAKSSFFRAKGASPYQPGATPQEWNRPTKQRAEGPIQCIGGYEVSHQFRGVTKMITQRNPAAGFYQCSSSQGFLDYWNRRRSRVTEDSSATARSLAQGLFTPRSRGNRQGILDGSNRTTEEGNYRGILGSLNGGKKRCAWSPWHRHRSGFQPSEWVAFAIPGAMPQAGIALGLWPSKSDKRPKSQTWLYFLDSLPSFAPCSGLPRQRRIFIPAWGNAPGHAHGYRMRAEGPTHLTAPCHNRSPIS